MGGQLLIIKLTSAQLSFAAAGTWLSLAIKDWNLRSRSITMRDKSNLKKFVMEPSQDGGWVKCRITRDRKGIEKGRNSLFIIFTWFFNNVNPY